MEKTTFSFLIGLMIIVIIIESTALISTSPPAKVGNISSVPTISARPTSNLAAESQPTVVQPTLVSVSPTRSNPSGTNQLAPIQKAGTTEIPTIVPISQIKYVQYDEPLPDGDDDTTNTPKASYFPVVTLPPVEYVDIFHENQAFLFNSTAISFNLINAPMKINYNVTPQMLVDEKWVMDRGAGRKNAAGVILNVTRFDENSWFQVTVFDKNKNNTIVLQDGFGNGHDQELNKEIIIRNPGNYQLKFEGNYISVDTLVSVPKMGNIPG